MNQISNSSRIEDLFEAVVALPPDERGAYLRAHCGDDAGLLEELQRLVRGHETAGDDFLRPPPADPRWQALFRREDGPDPFIGTRIGRYTIKSVIGVGGMGTVYLAEQESPRREVALKVMTAGVLTTRSALRRFEYESQVLARLRHPNIAHVYEAGTADVTVAADPRGRREAREGEAPAEPLNVAPRCTSGPSAVSPTTGKMPVPHREGEAPAEPSRTVRVAYFAMEYIPGAKSITRYAAENGLAVRERLALFLQVCDAVQYGHTKGVIHRDLKPGNILVGDESVAARVPARPCGTGVSPVSSDNVAQPPSAVSSATGKMPVPHRRGDATQSEIRNPPSEIVKVIDFGVAKSTDSDVAVSTLQTDVGQIIGTLQYMSPEQAGGTGASPVSPADIDTRSDVYSLGVVLYELLTERLPYDVSNMTLHSAMRRICEQAPTPPSRALHPSHGLQAVRCRKGDLETIILKALEKDREKRYQSAADLAADIRRYLAGEPISARPPTRWTRMLRWATRHPRAATVAACAAIAITMLAASAITVWLYDRVPYEIEPTWETIRRAKAENKPTDYSAARVLTRSGRPLRTWPRGATPGEDNVSNAVLVDRPESSGGGKLAIVGYSRLARSEFAGQLCAYDPAGNWDKPVWQSRMTDEMTNESRPEDQKNRPDRPVTRCAPQSLMAADVFPKRPGDEIVAIWSNGDFSQRAIRIYDAAGSLLYQVWQDGSIGPPGCWLPGPRLLVFAGADERLKKPSQDSVNEAHTTVQVVFAVRPFLGEGAVSNEYLERQSESSRHKPAWYRYVHPLCTAKFDFRVLVVPDLGSNDDEQCAEVRIEITKYTNCNVSFWVDRNGDQVPGRQVPTDEYNRLLIKGEVPDPSVFKLLSKDSPVPLSATQPDPSSQSQPADENHGSGD